MSYKHNFLRGEGTSLSRMDLGCAVVAPWTNLPQGIVFGII